MSLETNKLIGKDNKRQLFLLWFAAAISVAFLFVISDYIVALILAAVMASLMHPLYRFFLRHLKERTNLSSILTTLITVLLVFIPIMLFLVTLIEEAINISESAAIWAQGHLNDTAKIKAIIEKVPFSDTLLKQSDAIMERLGQVVARAGSIIANGLSKGIRGGLVFFLQAFVMLYGMYYFLIHGRTLVKEIEVASPISDEDANTLTRRFVSVSKATLKGSLVIGVVQGALAGVAYYFAGIQGAIFWATITGILSIIPGIGAPLIWVPIVIYLVISNQIFLAIALAIWCSAVVGTVDNVLRPYLVGRDTQMPDILVLVTTLGGIAFFGGLAGIIIGPMIGAIFITAWQLWRSADMENQS